ncbi:hypothetical protein MNBD_NITROSPINAE04-438 [hydrothermal vent metagenome]|uniref:Cytochrome c domain-containing protein n=1 Tax=hydrothermal vent metagenome TaxID=652676 RepID=A0A3B1C2Z0_9ZZZZ
MIRITNSALAAGAAVIAVALLAGIAVATELPVKGDASQGYKTYLAYCFICHGSNGEGNGPYATKLETAPKDLTDTGYFSSKTDYEIFEVISKGGMAFNKSFHMKPQGFRLATENIADLVAFIRFLNGRGTMTKSDIAAFTGKELFRFYCSSCHGAKGKGDGPLSRYLPLVPVSLSKKEVISKLTNEDLYKIIANGATTNVASAQNFMPSWGATLTRAQISGLIAYIRGSLAK